MARLDLRTNSLLDSLLKREPQRLYCKDRAGEGSDRIEHNRIEHNRSFLRGVGDANEFVGGIDLHPDSKAQETQGKQGTQGTGNLVVYGKYGKGKTTLSIQLATACAEQGWIAIYFSLGQKNKAIIENYLDKKEDEFPMLSITNSLHEDINKAIATSAKLHSRLIFINPKENLDISRKEAKNMLATLKEDLKTLEKTYNDERNKYEREDGKYNESIKFHAKLNESINSSTNSRAAIIHTFVEFKKNPPRHDIDVVETAKNKLKELGMQCENLGKECKSQKEKVDALDEQCKSLAKRCGHLDCTEDEDYHVALYLYQIEWLIQEINRSKEKDKVKMLVVDSLDEAIGSSFTRGQIHYLMQLLAENNIMGIFPLEDRSEEGSEAATFTNNVKYAADCVIALHTSYFGDYEQNHLVIEKNRTAKYVAGKHLYKITNFETNSKHLAKRYLNVMPSLHFLFTTLRQRETGDQHSRDGEKEKSLPVDENKQKNLLGDDIFNQIFQQSLTGGYFTKRDRHSQIVTLCGKSGLYKSDVGINALIYGLLEGQNGLILRLNDSETFESNGVRLNEKLVKLYKNKTLNFTPFAHKSLEYKYELKGWMLDSPSAGKLFELVFKKGAIQPEEWLDLVWDVVAGTAIVQEDLINGYILEKIGSLEINRICMTDLKFMGVSYEFLLRNETSGNMLLPTFTQSMKTKNVDVIFSASSSGIAASNNEIDRARELSNASISFDQNNGVTLAGSFDVINNRKYAVELSTNTATVKIGEIEHKLQTFHIR